MNSTGQAGGFAEIGRNTKENFKAASAHVPYIILGGREKLCIFIDSGPAEPAQVWIFWHSPKPLTDRKIPADEDRRTA